MAITTDATPTPAAPPQWDVSTFYPGLGSRELQAAHESVTADVVRLEALYDRHEVRGGAAAAPSPADHEAIGEVLDATNELMERIRLVSAYLYAHVTTDARDDEASGLQALLQAQLTPMTKLSKRFDAWVARFGVDALTRASEATPVALDHAFALRKAATAILQGESQAAAERALVGDGNPA